MSDSDLIPSRRLMLVHAHPDDESSQTALTMAKYAAEGARVTLVTCTLGELGEIVSEPLKQLTPDELGPYRLGELTRAMAALGVTDFVRLGGDGRYHDSGMAYAEDGSVIALAELRDDCFWNADLAEAANHLVALIRDRRPQVLITYDDFGGYGHPDHVKAHRVAMYAYLLAAVPGYRTDLGDPWQISRVFWSGFSQSSVRQMVRALRAAGDTEAFAHIDPDAETLPMGVDDAYIAARIHAPEFTAAQYAALAAHASQVDLSTGFFGALEKASAAGAEVWTDENYRLAAGAPLPGPLPADDLFAGLD
ncbi:N-acetyl-1-D-myo-inositol-2-amino-2-deoxy-alpha-D-glucopyranoside deacetylase [Naumannella halotolerans]|uniref:N-acetyl-1-D-myo-inositol-2-amino-2-deoxy-alpha- D-glucopyranoside deacetylase n=1 Tax=Naumannella halotolerans TaxID=993414 RepID=UPI00370D7B25